MSQWRGDGNRGHFVDWARKETDNWLPYSQSPRPYAACGVTVYRKTRSVFPTIRSFVISRQLFLIFSVPFSRLVLQCNTTAFVQNNGYFVGALMSDGAGGI